jgi:ribosome biogenesis GTPase A
MNINWFPGHMTKSLRMMEKEVKNVDIIMYLLDARCPNSSFNPKFTAIIGNKPVLYILNKYDLADDKKTDEFIAKLKQDNKNVEAIKLNASRSGAIKIVLPILKRLLKEKFDRFENKGINLLPKAMVIGVPNVGKSTFINNLANKTKAKAGNKAGVTRGKQLISLDNGVVLLDTPGTLWPSFEDAKTGVNLALVGSVRDEVIDLNELAFYLVDFLKENYKNALIDRYSLTEEEILDVTYETVFAIAKKRGFLLKGGDFDLDRTCYMLITEFRKGLLGNITLH